MFKDYYATLGVPNTATPTEIKRAYRKLARKFHPDLNKEADAEARFKAVAEAHGALIDPERRAAYDAICRRHERGEPFEPPPGWEGGAEVRPPRRPTGYGGNATGNAADDDTDLSNLFETLFRRDGANRQQRPRTPRPAVGADHHAKVVLDLEDCYRGARRSVSWRVPAIDAQGRGVLQDREVEVTIPPGVREGQLMRLAGQGGPGTGGHAAGDLYLEITLRPHPRFRVDGRDVSVDLPISPWEAALGATVAAGTPLGEVDLRIPAGSRQASRLRLKGQGLPGKPAGDLYAVLAITLPAADSDAAKAAYTAFGKAFPDYNPRRAQPA